MLGHIIACRDPILRAEKIGSRALHCSVREELGQTSTPHVHRYIAGPPATTLPPSLPSGQYPGYLPAFFEPMYFSEQSAHMTAALTQFTTHFSDSSWQIFPARFPLNNNQMQRKTKTTADVTPRGASKNIRLCRR